MKYMLIMIICAQVESTCYPPITLNKTFYTSYDCLQEGYKESQTLLKELGKQQVNKNKIIIKFTCLEKNKEMV